MKKYLLHGLLIALFLPVSMRAQMVSNDRTREKLFLREVKVIDEFIERFNDDPASFLRKEYKKAQREFPFTRINLINTLFNYHNNWADSNDKTNFILQVTNTEHPQKLSFVKKDWFAEAQCTFNYNKHEVKANLIMQVQTDSNKASKWMIVKASMPTDFTAVAATPITETVQSTKGKYFISPSSSATNFLDLHQVLKSDINPANFFTPEALNTPAVEKLVSLLKANKLTIDRVDNVKFYFYQIPNYIFTVEQFVRSESNSGWLINSLTHVTEDEKSNQKKSIITVDPKICRLA